MGCVKKAKLIRSGVCQGKYDYSDDNFIFYGLYIAPQIKYVLTEDKNGLLQEHKPLKIFNDKKKFSHFPQYFRKIEVKENLSGCRKAGKTSGVIIPAKMRFCYECIDKIICDRCNNQINENKDSECNINLLKRQPHHKIGYMLPYFEE